MGTELVERIKKIAQQHNLNLKETAIKAGIGENSIYRWKSQSPTTESLTKVAQVLGVSTDYLLGNDDDTKKDGLSVDEAVDNLRSYQGKPVSDDQKEVLKDLIKGYLDRNSK